MKVIIAGGTGFVGSYLLKRFESEGHQVEIVSRNRGHIPWMKEKLIEAVEKSDVLINLVGRNINCKHNEANKKQILDSRINSTLILSEVVEKCENPPSLWINASASAIYPSGVVSDEYTTEKSDSFLSQVVQKWEKVFFENEFKSTRRVALRTSVVLGRGSGALTPLVRITHLGLGGKAGSGKQFFSWIHIEDYFQIVMFLIENQNINGILNCTSPNPVTNSMLMNSLRKVLKMPFGIPAPEFFLKIGSELIRTEPELLLDSICVKPSVLLNKGYSFKFPEIESALSDLLKK